ncbi:FkbM family methyltransferase [Helicobacter sp. 11S02596-1]|uniref:FkbM family methyltransferase n=1 Tax=Helicobacter sp. 11S02596-1 TaxID=1476194 RepID=UPI000BA56DCF|nr:FkbM family methyltransferase [Helicobacter sp. 11S02596-1]
MDCGAHTGLISDLILHCGGRVHCFEPNIILNVILQNKYQNNPDVTINNVAVSDKNTTTRFLLNSSVSQINRISESGDNYDYYGESYEVSVIDLTTYIEDVLKESESIYLLKMDIEGAEFEIMDKIIAKKLYEKITYIVCETHESFFKDGDEKLKKLKDQLSAHQIENVFLDWI